MIEQDIENGFDQELKRLFNTKPDILNFLIKHERKQLCLTNLLGEIKKSPWLTKPQFNEIIKAAATLFAKAALDTKEKELISQAELKRLEHQSDLERLALEASEDIQKEANTNSFLMGG